MGEAAVRKVVVEVEIPEGMRLEELLRGVKYRILDPRAELEDILESAKRKRAKIGSVPTREEIYAERARY